MAVCRGARAHHTLVMVSYILITLLCAARPAHADGGEAVASSLAIISPAHGERVEAGNAVSFVIEAASTGSDWSSVRALLDGAALKIWSATDITALDGILTVIVEGLGAGEHGLVADGEIASGQVSSASVSFFVLAPGVAHQDGYDVGMDARSALESSRDQELPRSAPEGACFAGGRGAACLGGGGGGGYGGLKRWREAAMGGAFVKIKSPQVSEVFQADEDGVSGATVSVEVEVTNFEMGSEAGTMVVCLNDKPVYRAAAPEVGFKIGGLGLGSHVLTVSLFTADGQLVRGPRVAADGSSIEATQRTFMYPDVDAADCYAAFKVDCLVWPAVTSDSDALYRGAYTPRPFPQPLPGPSSLNGAETEVRMDLGGVYVWEELAAAYREFHAAAVRSPPGSVGLYVYTPRDCGWGNRLIDLASAYQIALLSERVLLVNWTSPVPLEDLATSELDLFPSSVWVRAHLEFARQQRAIVESGGGGAREQVGGGYLLLDLDSLGGPRSLSQIMNGFTAVEYHVGPVIRMTYDDQTWLYSKAFALFHPELAIALGTCLKEIIRPSSAVEQLIAARLGDSRAPLLGVHVRVTMSKEDGAGGDTQIGPSSTIPLRRQGQAMIVLTAISLLRSSPDGTKLFVATDNAAMRDNLATHPLLAPHVLAPAPTAPIVHSARERGLEAQLMMAADWWTLARSSQLVLTRQSTFGYIAAGAAGVVPYTVHEHKVERRFHCGPFALCDLHPADCGV